MPTPQPPPSPPATVTETEAETDTEPESPSSQLPPSTTFEEESSHTTITPTAPTTTKENNNKNIPTTEQNSSISPITSPPPYWTGRSSQEHPSRHARTTSNSSINPNGLGITLRDNENNSLDDRGSACWARSVQVTDYVIVNNNSSSLAFNIGAFVVWNIRVETLTGTYMNIRKRYSEFDDFRWRLVRTFPGFEAAVPELPPKSLISTFRPKFLEKRRAGLQYFLQ